MRSGIFILADGWSQLGSYSHCKWEHGLLNLEQLNIGEMTKIEKVNEGYYYFHIFDPDHNVCEVTGGYRLVVNNLAYMG